MESAPVLVAPKERDIEIKMCSYMMEGLLDAEIEDRIEEEFPSGGFGYPDLLKSARLKYAEEIQKAQASEDRLIESQTRVLLEREKLWIENWCFKNGKKMPSDPTQIPALYSHLKAQEELEERIEKYINDLEDDALSEFPHLSGSLSDLSDALYPDIPYGFKVMAAITHFGLMRSGLDTFEGTRLQPRFYTCLVAEPSHGKSAAINEIRTVMKCFKPASMIVSQSIDSGPAFVETFFRHIPSSIEKETPEDRIVRVLLDPDEATDMFEKAKVTANSKCTIKGELLKLYEENITENTVRRSNTRVENAHLAVLAGATPEGYSGMWVGTGGGSTGLQSRFVVVTTTGRKVPPQNLQRPSDPAKLKAALERIQKQVGRPPQLITMDAAAQRLLSQWDQEHTSKTSETRVSGFVSRLLIVLAVTNDTTIVDENLAAQAIKFGEYVIAVREKYNTDDSYNWTQSYENAIIDAFKKRPEYALTKNDIRRLVYKSSKPGGAGAFHNAWKNLVQSGAIIQRSTTSKGSAKYTLSD